MPTTDLSIPRFVCPNFEPYTNDNVFKGTWIKIKSFELKEQTAFITDDEYAGGLIIGDKEGPEWWYLAPPQVMENIVHTWEPWETVSSRLAGKGRELKQLAKEGASLKEALTSGVKTISVGDIFKNISSVSKAKVKVDTPLVYENTERREWTFQFNLTANSRIEGVRMMMGIEYLISSSLPVRTDDVYGLGIELPYVFTIISEPGAHLVNSDYAAITAIQPTYMTPYDEEGRPMKVELTVTFKELPALYAGYHIG